MTFPFTRPRRLRQNHLIRQLVREHSLNISQLVMPLFIVPGTNVRNPITSLPGLYQLSRDNLLEEVKKLRDLGISAVLLFAIPEFKDDKGSSACSDDGIIQRSIDAIRNEVPDMLVITDLCFCEYTSHGHCGIVKDNELANDASLQILAEQALSHARAGAQVVAPSGMLDGAVKVIRSNLDKNGFTSVIIMGYSAKFASGFYGPFREAVQSAPEFGDRRGYQMDPSNIEEALREVALDIEEGADIVMVKPGMAYLDVVRKVKDTFQMPTAVYNVSGEYAMIKAAAEKNWIDGPRVMCEVLTSMHRAGADILITYFAKEYAELAKNKALPTY